MASWGERRPIAASGIDRNQHPCHRPLLGAAGVPWFSHAESTYRSKPRSVARRARGLGSVRPRPSPSNTRARPSHICARVSHMRGRSAHARGRLSHMRGRSAHARGRRAHICGRLAHACGRSAHMRGRLAHARGSRTHAGIRVIRTRLHPRARVRRPRFLGGWSKTCEIISRRAKVGRLCRRFPSCRRALWAPSCFVQRFVAHPLESRVSPMESES